MSNIFLKTAFLMLLFSAYIQTIPAQQAVGRPSNYVLGVEAFQEGDYRRAFDAWSLGAYEGDAEAQYNLGVLYLEGQGIKADIEQAHAWFMKAANQNHLEAQYNLGHMSLDGMGVEKNVEAALWWWKRAAEGGYAQAQFNYGRALYLGIEGDADKQGGLLLIRRAALQKDKRALGFLEGNADEIRQLDRQFMEKPDLETKALIGSDTSNTGIRPFSASSTDASRAKLDVQLERDERPVRKDYIIRSANVPVDIFTQADFRSKMGQLLPGTLLKVNKLEGSKAQVSAARGLSIAVERAGKHPPSIQPRYGWIAAKNLAYSGETTHQLKAAWQQKAETVAAPVAISKKQPASSLPVRVKAHNDSDNTAQLVALEDPETVQGDIALPAKTQSTVNDNLWLFTQDKGAYVIQLFSLLNIKNAHTVSKEAAFRDRAHLYTTHINNKQWAVLLLGPYVDAAAARLAREELPANYAGMGSIRLIRHIAEKRCAKRKQLDAEQGVARNFRRRQQPPVAGQLGIERRWRQAVGHDCAVGIEPVPRLLAVL